MSDVQEIATLLEKIQQQVSGQLPNIVGYCAKHSKNMTPWAWSIDSNGIRVTPEELQSYRAHLFRLPCCLCSMQEAKGDVRGYTESEVYMSRKWEFFREYMLGCASPDKKCGYEISLEKPYSMPGLHTRHYASCDPSAKKQELQVPDVSVDMQEQEARQKEIAKLIERLNKQKDVKVPYILEFIAELMDLCPWTWPIDSNGIHVTPSEIQGYHAHLFRLPSCLCAMPLTEGEFPRYTASQVYVSDKWEFLREYMLGCASQKKKCGYEVSLERPYSTPGMPTQHYMCCEPGTEDQPSKASVLFGDIEKLAPRQIEDTPQKLNRLDAHVNPGVSPTEFSQLFVTCSECNQFMARRVVKHHRCTATNPEAVPAGYEVEEDD